MSSPGIFFIHEMPYLGCRLPAYWGGTFPFPWYLWLFLLSMFLGFWIWLWLYIDDCLCLDRLSGRSLNRWSGEHGISVLNFLVCFDLFAVSSFSSLSTICWITFPNFSVSDLKFRFRLFYVIIVPTILTGFPPPPPLTLQLNHNDYSLRRRAAFLIYTSAFHFNGYDFKQVVQSQWFPCV